MEGSGRSKTSRSGYCLVGTICGFSSNRAPPYQLEQRALPLSDPCTKRAFFFWETNMVVRSAVPWTQSPCYLDQAVIAERFVRRW